MGVSLFIASSLDGYIARQSGAVDWLFTDADYGYTEFFAGIDTVIMGRKTYQQILQFGDYPYSEKQSFVLSDTLVSQKDDNVEFIGRNSEDLLERLRESSEVWLVGGGEAIAYFLKHHWIDRLILSVHPIILGEGIPLILRDANLETQLELYETKTYESGLLQISYHLVNP
ncbi:MAG: dihydrofolate reductase family protein [Cyanobacteria bacterium P01_E01_bin.42]